MRITYKGKPIFPTRTALDELDAVGIDLLQAAAILEQGFEIRKRSSNMIERGVQKGKKIINVVGVDMGGYVKLIHAGAFTSSSKFRRLKDGL
ncbi:MAG: hypothetical protein AABX00_03795 [Nanoarchaeota archaeon]